MPEHRPVSASVRAEGAQRPSTPFTHRFTLIAALLTHSLALAQSSPIAPAQTHDSYRQVLIFAPPDDPRLQQQVEALQSHRSDLIDRQIMLVPFYRKYAGPVDTQIVSLVPQEEPFLRKRFHISDKDFTIILIGKDGGEKLRSTKPLTFDQLRDTIDSMPMRRREVQSRPKP